MFALVTISVMFVLTNVFWAWFAYKIICKHSAKEWELLERIRTPESSIMPPSMIEEEAKTINKKSEDMPVETMDFIETNDEFDLVGKSFPDGVPGRDEG